MKEAGNCLFFLCVNGGEENLTNILREAIKLLQILEKYIMILLIYRIANGRI